MFRIIICFGYWAECPKGATKEVRSKNCAFASECYNTWFELGGVLGLEGIMKHGEKRYDE